MFFSSQISSNLNEEDDDIFVLNLVELDRKFPFIQWKALIEKFLGNLSLPKSTNVLLSNEDHFEKLGSLIAETPKK